MMNGVPVVDDLVLKSPHIGVDCYNEPHRCGEQGITVRFDVKGRQFFIQTGQVAEQARVSRGPKCLTDFWGPKSLRQKKILRKIA